MFKKSVLVAAAILATVSLVGCGDKTTQNAASTTPTQTQQASGQATNGIALPSDKPAYMGRVINVANDQVTINKAELPAQPQGTTQGTPQGTPQGAPQDASQGANEKGPVKVNK